MKRILVIAALLIVIAARWSVCAGGNIGQLLNRLDSVVAGKERYADDRRQKIDALLADLSRIHTDSDRYNVYRSLYSLYRSYMGDSARWVAENRLEAARRTGDRLKINSALLNLAESYSMGGDNHRALEILDTLPRASLKYYQRKYLYSLYRTVYERMAKSDGIQSNVLLYETRQKAYLDSAISILHEAGEEYNLARGSLLILSGHPGEALPYLDQSIARSNPKYMSRLLTCKASALSMLGRSDEQVEVLAEAALLDLTSGKRDYTALPNLALLLLERGDSDRAYSYIRCALDDARRCNAKARTSEILELIPVIDARYTEAREHQMFTLWLFSGLLALMAVALAVSLYYLRQRNRNIRNINGLLQEANSRLSDTNSRLEESNNEKVRCLTEVFNAHSGYISRMAAYRASLLKNLTGGKVAKVRDLLESEAVNESELKDFYSRFDSIILKIAPGFIEQYNRVAKPEYRLDPSSSALTSELRVLALMKIGISRSSRIAELLHYSPQTIYNYKSAVRSSIALSKEEFEEWLQTPTTV